MIFEIYSMGDGLYMKRILDGVAMMSNEGFLLALGGFGLLLGLLLAGMKAIETGGQKVELPSLFVSFLLLLAMFSVKVDTAIYALDGAPGQTGMRMYTVDNVPVGIAFPAMAVTTMGKVITEKFQTAFAVPGMEDLGLAGGEFGNTLKLVDMARRWDISGLGGRADTKVSEFRKNLVAYMGNCTIPGIQRGAISKETLLTSSAPLSAHDDEGGIGFNDAWTSTTMSINGVVTPMDCGPAIVRLQQQANDAGMLDGFLKAALNLTDARSGSADATNAASSAFSAIGAGSSTIQQHVMASAVNEILDEAIAGSTALTPNEIQAQLMLIQGNRQRQDEWGAGEIMFRKAMRPFMAFLESFVFIATPFMVLVIGLGATGLKMVGKYFMINLWIMTWAPMFAAVELFQITMVQHAIKSMQMLGTGANGMPLSSIAGAAAINSELTTWIAVGGWMATLVPPMGYLLLSGGAVAMTSFAGRLSGGDHVNEKMTSPDLANVKAAMDVNSQLSHSRGMGTSVSGVDNLNGSFSFNNSATATIESSKAALQTASASAGTALNNLVSSTLGHSTGVKTTEAANQQTGHMIGDGKTGTNSTGVNTDTTDSSDHTKTNREATTLDTTGGVEVGANASGESKQANSNNEASNGNRGNGTRAARGSTGAKGGVSVGNQQTNAETGNHGNSAKLSETEGAKLDSVIRAESTAQKLEMLGRMAEQGSTAAKQVLDSFGKTQAAQDLQSASKQYSEANKIASTAQGLTGTSIQGFSNHLAMRGPEAVNEAVALAKDTGGDAAYKLNFQQVENQRNNGLFVGDDNQARAMAAAMTLAGTNAGAYRLIPGSDSDRLEALGHLANKYSVGGASGGYGNAADNKHISESAPVYGDATKQTEGLSRNNVPNASEIIRTASGDIGAGSGVDVDSVQMKANFAEKMGDGTYRDEFFNNNYGADRAGVVDKGQGAIRDNLTQTKNLADDVRYARALGDIWGQDGLYGGSASKLYGDFFDQGSSGQIPTDSGSRDVSLQRNNEKAEVGDSGDTRYQELRREIAGKSGFSVGMVDENAVNVMAAAALFSESRGIFTGGAYMTDGDADQLERSMQGLSQQQIQAIFGDTLRNDMPNLAGGDMFTSSELATSLMQPKGQPSNNLPKNIE